MSAKCKETMKPARPASLPMWMAWLPGLTMLVACTDTIYGMNEEDPTPTCASGKVLVTTATATPVSVPADTGMNDDTSADAVEDCDLAFAPSTTAYTGDLLVVKVSGEEGEPGAWTGTGVEGEAAPIPLTEITTACGPLWTGRAVDSTVEISGIIQSTLPEPEGVDCSSKVTTAAVYGLPRDCTPQLTEPIAPYLWLNDPVQVLGTCPCMEDSEAVVYDATVTESPTDGDDTAEPMFVDGVLTPTALGDLTLIVGCDIPTAPDYFYSEAGFLVDTEPLLSCDALPSELPPGATYGKLDCDALVTEAQLGATVVATVTIGGNVYSEDWTVESAVETTHVNWDLSGPLAEAIVGDEVNIQVVLTLPSGATKDVSQRALIAPPVDLTPALRARGPGGIYYSGWYLPYLTAEQHYRVVVDFSEAYDTGNILARYGASGAWFVVRRENDMLVLEGEAFPRLSDGSFGALDTFYAEASLPEYNPVIVDVSFSGSGARLHVGGVLESEDSDFFPAFDFSRDDSLMVSSLFYSITHQLVAEDFAESSYTAAILSCEDATNALALTCSDFATQPADVTILTASDRVDPDSGRSGGVVAPDVVLGVLRTSTK